MKSVLISIRPKWCEKIANGEKTIEVRKSRPRLEPPFKCYIYRTKSGVKHLFNGEWFIMNVGGNVIGEFVCDEVIPIKVFDNGSIQDWNNHNLERACVPYEEMAEYIGWGKRGYAWHISDLVIYNKPKELSEFRHCGANYHFNPIVTKPPQSWCYVEEGADE